MSDEELSEAKYKEETYSNLSKYKKLKKKQVNIKTTINSNSKNAVCTKNPQDPDSHNLKK